MPRRIEVPLCTDSNATVQIVKILMVQLCAHLVPLLPVSIDDCAMQMKNLQFTGCENGGQALQCIT